MVRIAFCNVNLDPSNKVVRKNVEFVNIERSLKSNAKN